MKIKQTGNRTHRLQVWIDDALLKTIKRAAESMGLDVSNWVRLALRDKIKKDKK